jgi:divalent metal cation (Fe/Co/Zn/Cd) transporter
MVALSIFLLGGGFSVHEGIHKILHRHDPSEKLGDPRWAYAILLISIALESWSFVVAMREFRTIRAGRGVRRTLEEARDPTVVVVLFEDLAALVGLLIALLGVALTHATGNLLWDGMASILVGLVLGAVAWMLARDSKSLLIGESVTPSEDERIREIVRAQPDVLELVHSRTLHRGPEEVILGVKVRFRADLDVQTLEHRINQLEAELRRAIPKLRRIYVEPGFDERAERTGAGV